MKCIWANGQTPDLQDCQMLHDCQGHLASKRQVREWKSLYCCSSCPWRLVEGGVGGGHDEVPEEDGGGEGCDECSC